MKDKKMILSAVILSGSIGLGAQSIFAQGAPDAGQKGPSRPERLQSPTPADPAGKQSRASSADIIKVKEALKAKGIDPGPINGNMDSKTQQALREFQKANQLRVTGTLDEQTAEKLGVTLGEKDSPSGMGTPNEGKSPRTSPREPDSKSIK